MFNEITKFDFLVKEFFKAQSSGNKSAEHYYLLEILSFKKSDLGNLDNKYTKLGQYGSSQHKNAEEIINGKYEFFLQHAISKCIDVGTQTENILEIKKVSEIQLLGNKEGINEEVFEDNF